MGEPLFHGVEARRDCFGLHVYPGDRLFVMARAGLPQLLYGPGGLKPTAPIQEILEANEGFRLISPESLGDFAGERIFILDPVDEEAKRSTDVLLESPIWKGLSAVKNGHVYRLYIQESDSDAYTRSWLLDKLPEMLEHNWILKDACILC
ncbi:ABC transporter substrate-binding protein [Paenibacillus melissococcoides]|uniref:ABC transporter substrate-binding protein n=1 Tax=Paenibacillus melissococcoides TaxID=2912268 RepID=A0ABM9G4G5_9BACL|nr:MULTISPECIES: ABC transporter substrate-binding protein [Paenibacillus]MEB9894522.1 ABC transporter substrate-binding protein [Bacillus cereus]CAH8246633.1 ABC transporter substrate-binding protein [Paenibacillus melissococcoides]CAH8715318.1 ABC transporter substrate-binding protein [Paenibacillus melissococcoides]CAH8716253.1 ABC transporter substrate-binding protein [Paenibacillus melissococcoides]GIO80008.1 hypothetical protein J6TS7_36180 [Paenibacillus dendritiformis]